MVVRPEQTAASAASHGRSRRPPLLAASYRTGARVLRALPPAFSHAAAAPGGSAWYWLNGRQRHAALDNYAAALGLDRSDPEVARVARRAFQNYGRMLMDFMVLGSLTPDELLKRVSYDGREDLDVADRGHVERSSRRDELDDALFLDSPRYQAERRKVEHEFTSAGSARFLNVHAPSCGFVDYMRKIDAGEEVDGIVYDSYPLD